MATAVSRREKSQRQAHSARQFKFPLLPEIRTERSLSCCWQWHFLGWEPQLAAACCSPAEFCFLRQSLLQWRLALSLV